MVEIIYDTHLSESGPWILPEAALLGLDEIVNTEWTHLQSRRDKLLEERMKDAVENRKKIYPTKDLTEKVLSELRGQEIVFVGKEHRSLRIFCEGSKTVSVTTFAEALRSPETVGEKARGFRLYLTCGDIEAELQLGVRDGSVDLMVRPGDVREAREFFIALRRWVFEYRPPAWQRFWRQIVGYHWFIWLLALTVSAGVASAMPDEPHRAAIAQGRQLLVGGLSNQEVRSAVEILLPIAVAENVKNTTVPQWFRVLLFGGFFISLLISLAPRTAIAIGSGAKSVKLWRWWAQFVGITLPVSLFGTFIWPYIEEIIRSML